MEVRARPLHSPTSSDNRLSPPWNRQDGIEARPLKFSAFRHQLCIVACAITISNEDCNRKSDKLKLVAQRRYQNFKGLLERELSTSLSLPDSLQRFSVDFATVVLGQSFDEFDPARILV